jgi:hypothetical protein
VGTEDVIEMEKIFNEIISLKYAADADGDVPICIDIVDRTRFEKPVGNLPIPYHHKVRTTKEFDEIVERACSNARSAMGMLDLLICLRKNAAGQTLAVKENHHE